MQVTMNLKTTKDPDIVYISGSMNFRTVEGLDEYIRTIRVARNWLAAQQKAAPSERQQEKAV